MSRDNRLGRVMTPGNGRIRTLLENIDSCWHLELTVNWQGCLPLLLHVHLERWKSVQDRFWWGRGQTMAGGPLRQVRAGTKLCSKRGSKSGRKKAVPEVAMERVEGPRGRWTGRGTERSWGLRELCLLVRAKVDL